MRRLNVIELTDGQRDALTAKLEDRDGPEHLYELQSALAALSPMADPALSLVTLRRVAERDDEGGEWAREALVALSDRVQQDVPEGPQDPAATDKERP